MLVYGNSLKNNIVGVVVIEDAPCQAWAKDNAQPDDVQALCKNNGLKKFILDAMLQMKKDKGFNSLELPKQIHLTCDPFTVENGILTVTQKLPRNEAKKVYQAEIDAMY